MHLAIVTPYPPAITGIGQYGYYASHLLGDSGEFSRISILRGGYTAGTEFLRMPNTKIPQIIRSGWHPKQLDAGWRIFSHLRHINPDLVWFNLGASVFGKSPFVNLSGFMSVALAHASSMATIVTLHELPELSDLRAIRAPGGNFSIHGARLLARLATRADVVCLTMQRYVKWLTDHLPGPRYLHIPNDTYHPHEILPEPGLPNLLFFSTLAPFKGLEVLLDTFQVLQKENPDLRLEIAGARHNRFPDYPEQVKSQYSHIPGINWLGEVAESDIKALFQRATVVVLPYEASTGSSSIMMQAAGWGRVIVASDLEDIQAAAAEKKLTINIFQRGQAADLSRVLKSQLASMENRRLQIEANITALAQFGPDRTRQAYLQAFNLALQTRQAERTSKYPVRAP